MVTLTAIFNSYFRQVPETYQDNMTASTHIISNLTFIFTLLLHRKFLDFKARVMPEKHVKIHAVPHFILEVLNLIPLLFTFITDLQLSLSVTSNNVLNESAVVPL
jgi:hypothetical protein